MAVVLLFAILPVKLYRFTHLGSAKYIVGIAPSLLGPAGFFFLLLSSPGARSRWTLPQIAMLVASVSLGLELLQLIPRSGLLARPKYTFDYNDLAASAVSIALAYVVAVAILRRTKD